jgi:hypothetical protein
MRHASGTAIGIDLLLRTVPPAARATTELTQLWTSHKHGYILIVISLRESHELTSARARC